MLRTEPDMLVRISCAAFGSENQGKGHTRILISWRMPLSFVIPESCCHVMKVVNDTLQLPTLYSKSQVILRADQMHHKHQSNRGRNLRGSCVVRSHVCTCYHKSPLESRIIYPIWWCERELCAGQSQLCSFFIEQVGLEEQQVFSKWVIMSGKPSC